MLLNKEDIDALLSIEEFGHFPHEFPVYRRIMLEKSGVIEESDFGLKLTGVGAELLLQSPYEKPAPVHH